LHFVLTVVPQLPLVPEPNFLIPSYTLCVYVHGSALLTAAGDGHVSWVQVGVLLDHPLAVFACQPLVSDMHV
jgi:hypothetical protein